MDVLLQFFRFDKFMKDRLVALFFYIGLVLIVFNALGDILSAIAHLDDNFFGALKRLFWTFLEILFIFIGLRLLCELMVAIFRINDNVSPDGGASEKADIDVFETARGAAAKTAQSASVVTKQAFEKTKSKISEVRTGGDEDDAELEVPPPSKKPAAKKPAARKVPAKKPPAKQAARKTATKKPAAQKAPAKKAPAKKSAAKKPAPKPDS